MLGSDRTACIYVICAAVLLCSVRSRPCVVHVISCCITASALYNVAVPALADLRRSSHELFWKVVKFEH